MSLYEKPAHILHDMLTRKEISARELTEDVLSRMDAVENEVGAYLLEDRSGEGDFFPRGYPGRDQRQYLYEGRAYDSRIKDSGELCSAL